MAAWACSSPKRRVGGADGDGGDDDVHHGVEDDGIIGNWACCKPETNVGGEAVDGDGGDDASGYHDGRPLNVLPYHRATRDPNIISFRQGFASQLMKTTCRRVNEKWNITPVVHIGERKSNTTESLKFA